MNGKNAIRSLKGFVKRASPSASYSAHQIFLACSLPSSFLRLSSRPFRSPSRDDVESNQDHSYSYSFIRHFWNWMEYGINVDRTALSLCARNGNGTEIKFASLNIHERRGRLAMEWNVRVGEYLKIQKIQPFPVSYLYLRYIFSQLSLMVSVSKYLKDKAPHVSVS